MGVLVNLAMCEVQRGEIEEWRVGEVVEDVDIDILQLRIGIKR